MNNAAGVECSIAVGSRNPVKINAVYRAFQLLCTPRVVSVDTKSIVPSQPIGFNQILLGALYRAVEARSRVESDYGVGIEAGAIDDYEWAKPIELQVAVIVDSSGRVSIGLSQGFLLPSRWFKELSSGVELEAIVEKETGRERIGETIGLIGYLTRGLITRTDLSYNAVVMALVPLLNLDLYRELPLLVDIAREFRELERFL